MKKLDIIETWFYRQKEGAFWGFVIGIFIYLTKIFPYNLITKMGEYFGRTDGLFYATITIGLITIGGVAIDAIWKPKQ
ncbi:MAG: hypothetical protein KKD44_27455 [Proteobacteria bacterium]|nr:hypothetical protein [Pseudomonadota bacterium]